MKFQLKVVFSLRPCRRWQGVARRNEAFRRVASGCCRCSSLVIGAVVVAAAVVVIVDVVRPDVVAVCERPAIVAVAESENVNVPFVL